MRRNTRSKKINQWSINTFCPTRQNITTTCKPKCTTQPEKLCGSWSAQLADFPYPIYSYAISSGPDESASFSTAYDTDPRVYVMGGILEDDSLTDRCWKYNPNDDTWIEIASMPVPAGNISSAFVPNYDPKVDSLGYIYVSGNDSSQVYAYDIKLDTWNLSLELPIQVTSPGVEYLDDIGGPLAQLFVTATGVNLPPCTDSQTLWVIGGVGTEQRVFYAESDIQGNIVSTLWNEIEGLPLLRKSPITVRTFWRDAGITSFGVSNCATIVVAGGYDEEGNPTDDVQLLVRNDCNWAWITVNHNPTSIPNTFLKLAYPVADGAGMTEQWPETLVTGGRPIIVGGKNFVDSQAMAQFAQFRFSEGRWNRDKCIIAGPTQNSDWNVATNNPQPRIKYGAAPLSQVNSSIFGGRRVSRFVTELSFSNIQ